MARNGGKRSKASRLLKMLGPGLITGASDDDPSGIATYSQVGAQFGFGLLWSVVLTYPLMAAIQEISARVGRVTGRGIAGCMRKYYPGWIIVPIVGSMVIANVINLGADIAAMGASLTLVVGGSSLLYAALFTALSLGLQIYIPYSKYVSYLKWLTLVLLAYIITAFRVEIPWGEALRSAVLPEVAFSSMYLTAVIAVLGTTISPYLFFWQASQEVENVTLAPRESPLKSAPHQAPTQLRRIRFDTLVGMAASNLVSFFVILTTAATIHTHGPVEINSAMQAAEALRPFGGRFAFLLFSIGIIGTGLLALPVLAGSAAYALGEILRWPIGLERKPRNAKGFYGILAAAMLVGLGMNLASVNPIKALYWSAVINGLASTPIMVVLMHLSSSSRVMGKFSASVPLKIVGWLATVVMFLASVGLVLTWGKG